MNNFREMGYFSGPAFGDITICDNICAGKTITRLLSGILYCYIRDIIILLCNLVAFYSRKYK